MTQKIHNETKNISESPNQVIFQIVLKTAITIIVGVGIYYLIGV